MGEVTHGPAGLTASGVAKNQMFNLIPNAMKSLTTKQIFTIQLALRWMRTRKEQISNEFTGEARKSYQDDIKQIDSILETLGETISLLLGSKDLSTMIEVRL